MRTLVVVLTLAATAVAACGGDDGSTAEPPGAPPASAPSGGPRETVVEMTDALQFEPKTITVAAGTTVEWRNVGNIAHTVTADAAKVADASLVELPERVAPFDSGIIAGGKTFAQRFDTPGTYRYVCIPHEGTRMIGTVVVEG